MSVEHPSHRESEHSVDANFVEAADAYLDELTKLAERCNSSQDFYRFLIDRLQILLVGDVAWVSVRGASGDWVPVVVGEDGDGAIKLSDDGVVGAVGSPKVKAIELPDDLSIIYTAVVAGGAEQGSELSGNECCICVRMKRASDPAWRRISQDLISATTDIAVGFEQRQQLQSQNERFARLESFVKLVQNSQISLDLEKTGYHLANDCRHFLGADRVWIFSKRGRIRFCACSNVATVNERSRSYKSLFSAVQQIDRTGRKEVVLSEASDCPSELSRLVGYLNTESSVNGFYLSALLDRASGKVHGYFVAEYLQEHDCVTAVSSLKNMLPVVENAIANSQSYSYLPGRGLMQTIGSVIDRFRLNALPRTLVALLAITGMLAALMLIKIDFELPVTGQVRPSLERNTFAPTDGVVDKVLVEYGDTVNAQQPMLNLVSSNYEEKLSGLQSELSAAAKELEANELLQSSSNDGERDPAFASQLIAQIEQNRLNVESIEFVPPNTAGDIHRLCIRADRHCQRADIGTTLASDRRELFSSEWADHSCELTRVGRTCARRNSERGFGEDPFFCNGRIGRRNRQRCRDDGRRTRCVA